MSDEFLAWAGLTEDRWYELLEKLRGWVTEGSTPADVISKMLDDMNIGDRERVVLAFIFGVKHLQNKTMMMQRSSKLMFVTGVN